MITPKVRDIVTMIAMLTLFVLLSNPADVVAQSVAPADSVHWVDLESGFATARSANKPVFLWFYGDDCPYCQKMREKVYTDTGVVRRLNASFVPIKIEGSSQKRITYDSVSMTEADFARQKFNARRIPSTWFVEPNGCRIRHLSGYRPVGDMIINLDSVATKLYGECQNVSLANPPRKPTLLPDSLWKPPAADSTKK